MSTFSLTVQRNASTSSQPDSVLQWDQITLQAIQSAADDPVVAARVLALESLAVYGTINSINGSQSFFAHLGAPADTVTDAAVAAAAHEVLSALYPQEQTALDALFAQSLSAIPNGQGKIDGVALGTQIADDILQLRANDGSQISVADPGSDAAGQWRPTGPDFGLALSRQFANITPFALNSPDRFLSSIAPPLTLDSAAYAAAVKEVDALGSVNSTQRTADHGIFAGTDFQFSNLAGQALGKDVGDFVLQTFNIAHDSHPPRILVNQPSGASGISTATNIVTNTNVLKGLATSTQFLQKEHYLSTLFSPLPASVRHDGNSG